MNLPCIVIRISSFIFLPSWLLAQTSSFDTAAFYRHLKDENLLLEQIVFGQNLTNVFPSDLARKDSLLLNTAACYLKLNMPDSCKNNLKKISAMPNFPERKMEYYLSSLLLMHEYATAEKNLSAIHALAFNNDARVSISILKREIMQIDTAEINISPFMLDLKNRYIAAPHHSPVLAGVFSALLPGGGKWYIGYKKQALTAFLANALFAAQAIESCLRSGVSSPRFILTASLFGVFYAGNIWGSVLAAKKKKRDALKELDYEILDHYHTEFTKLSR